MMKKLVATDEVKHNLAVILDIGKSMQSSLDYNKTLKKIIQTLESSMDCEAASVLLLSEDGQSLSFFVVEGKHEDKLTELTFPADKGIAGHVISTKKSVMVNDAASSPFFYKAIDEETEFITRSILACPVKLQNKIIGVIEVINKKTGDFNENDQFLLEAISGQAAISIDNANLYSKLANAYLETIEVVALAIDARDPYTYGHSKRVSEYAVELAKALNLKIDLERLKYGAILHDIGKIGVSDIILHKDGRPTNEEFDLIKKHPVIGASLIEKVSFLHDVVPFIKYHHEKIDGTGYPHGLKGAEIPLEARIISVADTFDALTSNRPYRGALDMAIAKDRMSQASGDQLDEALAAKFVEICDESYKRVNAVELGGLF